jgi:predicted  nucleic acid-binding Zn-ribbon protein
MKKIEDLKKDLGDRDKQVDKLKKDLVGAAKVEEDKSKLLKEVGDKAKKITDLEKRLKEADERCKRTDKMLNVRKERVAKLEKEVIFCNK